MSPTKNQIILTLLIAIPLLLLQANWIFHDARKRGVKNYWLWGLSGLINFPQSVIVYLVVTRIIFKKKDK